VDDDGRAEISERCRYVFLITSASLYRDASLLSRDNKFEPRRVCLALPFDLCFSEANLIGLAHLFMNSSLTSAVDHGSAKVNDKMKRNDKASLFCLDFLAFVRRISASASRKNLWFSR